MAAPHPRPTPPSRPDSPATILFPFAEIHRLRAEKAEWRGERRALRRELSATQRALASRDRRIGDLEAQVRRLTEQLEEARRAAKRQAAPFSRNTPKADPKKSGRRPGKAYGRRGSRDTPSRADETVDAFLPDRCPNCGAAVEETDVCPQYQTDIPERVETKTTRFDVHVGRCRGCGRRFQGRHPRQTSNALGAASNQIGPNALAFAAYLNKELGVPHGRIVKMLRVRFGLMLAKATVVRGIERLGTRAEPLYRQIWIAVRKSARANGDETSWRVNGRLWWLWDFVTPAVTLYVIRHSRGSDVVLEVLGPAYVGTVGHDGWHPWEILEFATHQTCLWHPLERCRELLEIGERGAVRFPRMLQEVLRDGIALGERRDLGQISEHGLTVARGRLEGRLDRLLEGRLSHPGNARLAKHLLAHREQIFTFLYEVGVEPANWPAEQEIRPAVVTRKISAGNRSPEGAHAQEVLMSVLRTCVRQDRDPIRMLVAVQRAASPERMPRFRLTGPGRACVTPFAGRPAADRPYP